MQKKLTERKALIVKVENKTLNGNDAKGTFKAELILGTPALRKISCQNRYRKFFGNIYFYTTSVFIADNYKINSLSIYTYIHTYVHKPVAVVKETI